jgi:hypothetical protein
LIQELLPDFFGTYDVMVNSFLKANNHDSITLLGFFKKDTGISILFARKKTNKFISINPKFLTKWDRTKEIVSA